MMRRSGTRSPPVARRIAAYHDYQIPRARKIFKLIQRLSNLKVAAANGVKASVFARTDVQNTPISEQEAPSLNHFIGLKQNGLRDRHAKRVRDFVVDDELEFG